MLERLPKLQAPTPGPARSLLLCFPPCLKSQRSVGQGVGVVKGEVGGRGRLGGPPPTHKEPSASMGPAMHCCHLAAPKSNANYLAEKGDGGKMEKVGLKEKEEDRERPEGGGGAEEDRRRESEVEGQKEPGAHSNCNL